MTVMTLCLMAGAIAMAAAGGLVFAVMAHRGAFDELEDVKFQILREEPADEQPQVQRREK